jgi:hypothetical protein
LPRMDLPPRRSLPMIDVSIISQQDRKLA